MSGIAGDLTADYLGLSDGPVARRYFRKFDAITRHLRRVVALMEQTKSLSRREARMLAGYIARLDASFDALGYKYLMTGRDVGQAFAPIEIDRSESGFPVYREILTMATDAAQARKHLSQMPSEEGFKAQMVAQIVGERTIPTRLQFALSQRLYYQALLGQDLFWAANDPEAQYIGQTSGRLRFLLHWAVYDSQINLPTVYLMEVEDSAKTSLPKDPRRWPEVQRHLMAQSLAGLKLVTIAKGFDEDFDDLHPKRLRRLHLGPMYSSAFTAQKGPIGDVLREAQGQMGEDWALAWTVEELESKSTKVERSGWFRLAQREVYLLDPLAEGSDGADSGATRTERAIVLPERPYQVLAERQPKGFANVTKFVTSANGRVMRIG